MLGAVTGPILDSKICRCPGLAGRQDCRGAQQNDLETFKPILISSSHLVPLFETASYFRRSKGAIRMLLATAVERPVSCRVTVSCLVSPSHAIVSSFVIRVVPQVGSVLSQLNHVNRRGECIPPAEAVLFGVRFPTKHVALRLALRSVDAGRGSGRG